MIIEIHRGQNQIGGSIIEVATDSTRIILDAGMELDEEVAKAPDIDGLFTGEPGYDAVFISHNHGDHIGLLDQVLPGIPAYIGKRAAEVTAAARAYMHKPQYDFTGYYESEVGITIGDLTVTPYFCDHSAFDSYMLHVTDGKESVLYTGDFRANGRKSFPSLLSKLPKVNTLITEGTTLTREDMENRTERELEADATKIMEETDGPVFVLMAAQNIDRVVTIYKATYKAKRIMLQDLYAAAVTTAAGDTIPNPQKFGDVKVFMAKGGDEHYGQLCEYKNKKISRAQIAKENYVMCVRPSMQGYLEKLAEIQPFENGILLYSMWSGYKEKPGMDKFLKFMEDKGVTVRNLHTSGHADTKTLDSLVKEVSPERIIPVHTENSAWFERYKDTCEVIISK